MTLKSKWSIDTSYKPWKHYVKWKRIKIQIIWFHLCEIYRIDKPIDTENRLVAAWGWDEMEEEKGKEWGVTANVYRISFRSVKNALKLDCGDGCKTLQIYKKHWTPHIKWVDFMVCEICVNKIAFRNT